MWHWLQKNFTVLNNKQQAILWNSRTASHFTNKGAYFYFLPHYKQASLLAVETTKHSLVYDSLHWQERIISKKALLAYLPSGLHETCRQQLHFKCKLVAGFLLLVKEEAENKARSNKNWYGTWCNNLWFELCHFRSVPFFFINFSLI